MPLPYKTLTIYGRSAAPASIGLRLAMWSRFSHQGIYDETTNTVIEATASHGVVETPLAEFLKRYSYCEIHSKPSAFPHEEVLARARSQKGKKYDWSGIFGIAFRTGWSNLDKWFCSELWGWSAGVVSEHRVSRYTVEDSYKLAGEVVRVYKRNGD